ncbi:STAS domain-containing protein [Nocardioides sp. ChNu-153]|uniref:STAS domain-containing protein n=1 Tax=unclassified Nocardioides TaxID=2615069 RepID=UPI0024077286|nr:MULTISPECIES: STAS domain-containing protein [unclassified Nocardioides]MDF9714689.1 STAS domain-containing protein [Nocardioides sp. ChNu-99]MDN7119778.1 STAS domain-containing protein [Nocardioides sp. ChNu-153]
MQEIEFASTFDAATSTVTIVGGVYDFRDVEKLDAAIMSASDDLRSSITLDLSAAQFFPSLGIGTLVALRRRARAHGTQIRVVAAEGSIAHRVLTVTGVECEQPG